MGQFSIVVAVTPPDIPKYERAEWRHWADEDGDCQDARQEVLIEESKVPVSYEDTNQCRVVSGMWTGLYIGDEFTDPGDLDIDHMVPLADAHNSGGWAWDGDKRRRYANDLSYKGTPYSCAGLRPTGPREAKDRRNGSRQIPDTGASMPLTG